MKGIKILGHPVTKPVLIDTLGAVIAVTADWDDEGRRRIRIKFRCKSDAEAFWLATRTTISIDNPEIQLTRHERPRK